MTDLKMTTTGDYMTPQQVIDYLLAENGTFPERKAARMAAERITQQAQTIANLQAEANALKTEVSELKSELNCVNEYKDKLTAAVLVLIDQLKSGKVSGVAIYDVDILLGE